MRQSIASVVTVALILGGIAMLVVIPLAGLLMFVGGLVVMALVAGNAFA